MDTKQINEILRTFELSERVEERVRAMVLRRVKDTGIDSFTDIYQWIAEDVFNRQTPWREKNAVRLDRPQYPNSSDPSRRFVHESIGDEDPHLVSLIDTLTADDVLYHVLGEKEREIINKLKRSLPEEVLGFCLDGTLEEVLEDKKQIIERTGAIIDLFSRDGELEIPRRPIRSVSFEPELQVNYGRRHFDGDPLSFFRENIDFYGPDVTRTELMKRDQGLYQALRASAQLDQAIPHRYGRLDLPPRLKKKSYRGFDSPLAYLRANIPNYVGLTRTTLYHQDGGLYQALRNSKQLDEVFKEHIISDSQPVGREEFGLSTSKPLESSPFAEEKAAEYLGQMRNPFFSRSQLCSFFDRYHSLKQDGLTLSISDLARSLNASEITTRKVLRAVNLSWDGRGQNRNKNESYLDQSSEISDFASSCPVETTAIEERQFTSPQDKFAHENASRYLATVGRSSFSYSNLYPLLARYYFDRTMRAVTPLTDLAESLGASVSTTRKILKTLDLPCLTSSYFVGRFIVGL